MESRSDRLFASLVTVLCISSINDVKLLSFALVFACSTSVMASKVFAKLGFHVSVTALDIALT